MKKILILGAGGNLGSALKKLYQESCRRYPQEYEIIAWDINDLDVTDFFAARRKIAQVWPDVIYNTVAYNNVDACEKDEEEYQKAQLLNVAWPEELAKIAKNLSAVLVHYSSDYVFGGDCLPNKQSSIDNNQKETHEINKDSGYTEDDQPAPVNRYGKTKYEGELAIQEIGGRYYIIRLSRLFGGQSISPLTKKSFFKMMLEKGQCSTEVRAVDDEESKYIYAPDLAQESKNIVEGEEPDGIYHIINEGTATWYQSLRTLYRLADLETKITPVSAEEFKRAAKRPRKSVLCNTKRPPLRSYEEALREWLLTWWF